MKADYNVVNRWRVNNQIYQLSLSYQKQAK